jgi:DNA-binding MarR family transcriptional regulator
MSSVVTPEEWDVWRTFHSMRRKLDLALERQLQRDADISAADYGILLALFEAPNKQLRGRDLGERLSWEKSRISHQVSRMEKRGLLERRECETDLRGSWIGLTNDGTRAVLGAMRDHAATLRRYFFDVLDPAELEAFKAISHRVIGVIEPELCDSPES